MPCDTRSYKFWGGFSKKKKLQVISTVRQKTKSYCFIMQSVTKIGRTHVNLKILSIVPIFYALDLLTITWYSIIPIPIYCSSCLFLLNVLFVDFDNFIILFDYILLY